MNSSWSRVSSSLSAILSSTSALFHVWLHGSVEPAGFTLLCLVYFHP